MSKSLKKERLEMLFGGGNVLFNMVFKWNYTPVKGMSVSVQKYKIMLTG
jgi:hypothetical protein